MISQVWSKLNIVKVTVLCSRFNKVQNRFITVVSLEILFVVNIVAACDQSWLNCKSLRTSEYFKLNTCYTIIPTDCIQLWPCWNVHNTWNCVHIVKTWQRSNKCSLSDDYYNLWLTQEWFLCKCVDCVCKLITVLLWFSGEWRCVSHKWETITQQIEEHHICEICQCLWIGLGSHVRLQKNRSHPSKINELCRASWWSDNYDQRFFLKVSLWLYIIHAVVSEEQTIWWRVRNR